MNQSEAVLGRYLRSAKGDKPMTDLADVQKALDQAAIQVATLDPDDWSGWVTYLLEALDSEGRRDFDAVLEAVREAIDVRLQEDRW